MSTEQTDHTDEEFAAARAARFGHLPAQVASTDLVMELPADPPNDPNFGGDPETDWMIRYSAG
ncbi:MAG TPA: hypothetical protein VHF06_09260 [Pseudonocardiaceae bacterium]|jgi:hypothetical protein|nr:hypothetical protein [Pseudonocardiaceae bacterium]